MFRTPRRLKYRRRPKPPVGSSRWFRGYRIAVVLGWLVVLVVAAQLLLTDATRSLTPKMALPETVPLADPAPANPPAGEVVAAPSSPNADAPHQVKAERWAYSGHLRSASGDVFSIYVAALQRGAGGPAVFHGSVLDHTSGKHFTDQVKAEGVVVAGRPDGFGVSSGAWQLSGRGAQHVVKLAGKGFALDLAVADEGAPVNGVLDAGASGKNQYNARPRMKAVGSLALDGVTKPVQGEVWLDHQWGDFETLTLRSNWFGLHLADGAEVMIYELLDRRGAALLRTGTHVRNGKVTALGKSDFKAAASGTWRSPSSGVVYPMDWAISVPALGLAVKLKPVIRHSQFNARATGLDVYWAGAVTLNGAQEGSGFMVLTGYEAPPAPVKKKK